MNDLNIITIIGRLTRDAELKYTTSGQPICKFSIAVNRSVKNGDNWAEEANFFDVTLWGKRGESLKTYLTKGKQIAISGSLKQDRWEQDGENRSKFQIIAENVQLLGGNSGAAQGENSDRKEGPTRNPDEEPNAEFTDDIPF